MLNILLVLFIFLLSFIVAHYFYLDPLGIGKHLARKSFPEAAQELGLRRQSTSGNQLGNYSGKYKQHFVKIEFESARIQLNMKSISGISLSTSYDRASFSTQDEAFDSFFSERIASSSIADKIKNNETFLNFVSDFKKKWQSKLKYFVVNEDYIECRFKYGYGHYIPGDVLKKFLPDLVRFTVLLHNAVYKY